MNEYSGEAFLDKLYPSLHLSEQVLHTQDKSKTNAENIRTYLERIEHVHDNVRKNNKLERLLKLYYDQYVISENNIDIYSLPEETSIETIIANQKNSLKEWITYLSSEGANYPLWAKYWAFQGMLKIGNYNELYDPNEPKTGKAFTSRSKKTITPFIKCNPELIAKAIELIVKYNNGKKLDDEEVEKLVESGSFSKIYGILFYRNKQQNKNKRLNITEGIWVKYNQGSREDATKLCESLQGYDTGWCTASIETAISQVCGEDEYDNGGDFYVYYSKDENGEYKVPRIAIRMEDKDYIGEIRGIDVNQNLDELMLPILETKLNEMDNIREEDKKENLQIIDDLKFLTEIYRKYKLDEELTLDELKKFLSVEKFGFGWENEKRADELVELPIYKIGNKEAKYNKELILLLVKNNCDTFKYVPNDIDNYNEFIKEVIQVNGLTLKYVPKESINYELCMLAVEQDSYALEFVPPRIDKYDKIASKAVEKNAYAIKYVHGNMLINSLLFSIRRSLKISSYKPNIIKYIPESFKLDCPDDFFNAVLNIITINYSYLSDIDSKDPIYFELVFELVSRFKESILGYVKEECFTNDFMKKIIQINKHSINHIPEKKLNDEIIKCYLDNNGTLFNVPITKINYEVGLYAVKKYGRDIEYVPEKIVDKKMAKEALNNGCQINLIPKKLIDKELLDISFKNKQYSLNNVPGELIDYDTATMSVSDNGLNLEFVPEELKDNKLANLAFSNTVKAIKFIPEKFITFEMSQKAVNEDPYLIEFIPKAYIDNNLAMLAVKEDGMLLRFIPRELITFEMVVAALLENVHTPHDKDSSWDYQCYRHYADEYANYIKTKQKNLSEFIDKDLFDRASIVVDKEISQAYSDADESIEEMIRERYM